MKCGIDMSEEDTAHTVAHIQDKLACGLSPKQIATTSPVPVAVSTIYRWVHRRYSYYVCRGLKAICGL